MKEKGGIIGVVVLILMGIIFRMSCSPSADDMIEESIRLSEEVAETMLSSSPDIFDDIDVFRDGEDTGIIHELYYTEDYEIDEDEIDPEIRKASLVNYYKNSADFDDFKLMMDKGIYFVFRYIQDDELLAEFTIDEDDF